MLRKISIILFLTIFAISGIVAAVTLRNQRSGTISNQEATGSADMGDTSSMTEEELIDYLRTVTPVPEGLITVTDGYGFTEPVSDINIQLDFRVVDVRAPAFLAIYDKPEARSDHVIGTSTLLTPGENRHVIIYLKNKLYSGLKMYFAFRIDNGDKVFDYSDQKDGYLEDSKSNPIFHEFIAK
jgi:hypothetical protein